MALGTDDYSQITGLMGMITTATNTFADTNNPKELFTAKNCFAGLFPDDTFSIVFHGLPDEDAFSDVFQKILEAVAVPTAIRYAAQKKNIWGVLKTTGHFSNANQYAYQTPQWQPAPQTDQWQVYRATPKIVYGDNTAGEIIDNTTIFMDKP